MTHPAEIATARDAHRLAAYLRDLRWALSALPASDRDEIVAETRSHLLDRVAAGAALDSALAALGDARDYARPFVDSYRRHAALAHGRTREQLALVGERIASSARAAWTALLLILLWAPGLALAGTAIVKLRHPEIAGLWVGPRRLFVGTIDDPTLARELLGFWIFPVAVVALVAAWILTRRLLAAAVRRLGAAR